MNNYKVEAWCYGLAPFVGIAIALSIGAVILIPSRGCSNSSLPERVERLEEKVDELRLQTEYLTDLDIEGDIKRANYIMDEINLQQKKRLDEEGIAPTDWKVGENTQPKDVIMRRAEQQRIRRENSKSGGWTPEDDKPKKGYGRYDDPGEEDEYANDEDESDTEDWEDE